MWFCQLSPCVYIAMWVQCLTSLRYPHLPEDPISDTCSMPPAVCMRDESDILIIPASQHRVNYYIFKCEYSLTEM